MTEIALHTVLIPGTEAAYEAAHAAQSAEMSQTLRDAGVISWRIWRSGIHLFHLVEIKDVAMMNAYLAASPVNAQWDDAMSAFVAVPPDWRSQEHGLPMVWTLPPAIVLTEAILTDRK